MTRHRGTRWLIAALTLSGMVAAGLACGRAINRSAERSIREALPDAIGPAREYRVHIENAPLQSVSGRFSNIVIDGADVQFPSGILLDKLHIDIKNVDIDTSKRRVRHVGSARFTIIVSENSLNLYLAGEHPPGEAVRGTRLAFRDNNVISVAGERVTLLNVWLPFRLTGPVRIASPTRIELDARRLDVAGIPLTGRVLGFFKSRIESSLDLSQFPAPVRLSELKTQPGQLMLSGQIDADGLLERARMSR